MKILFVTNSEKRVKELKEIIKKNIDVTTIDSLFDLEYEIILNDNTRDINQKARKKAQAVWKKEKDNYDYIIADEYGLFLDFAPNLLGVESDSWWPGTQRDRSEALVNLFTGVKEREIYYKSIFVAIGKSGKVIEAEGYTYGYLAKKVREKNGDGYDSVFITQEGKYMSSLSPKEIYRASAKVEAMEKLSQLLS